MESQIHHNKHPAALLPPTKAFSELMQLYDINYTLLRKLQSSPLANDKLKHGYLHFKPLQTTQYTEVFELICSFKKYTVTTPISPSRFKVRIYHDTRQAEVLTDPNIKVPSTANKRLQPNVLQLKTIFREKCYINTTLYYVLQYFVDKQYIETLLEKHKHSIH